MKLLIWYFKTSKKNYFM